MHFVMYAFNNTVEVLHNVTLIDFDIRTVEKVSALVHSPPLEGWQAKPDGVVVVVLH